MGIFSRRKVEQPQEGVPAAGRPVPDDGAIRAVDAVAALLREYGHWAFDIERTSAEVVRRSCEAWAQHLLIGAPRPGETSPRREPTALGGRDLMGAVRFFSRCRQDESAFVVRSLGAFQHALWAFIQTLDGVVGQGGRADDHVKTQLDRLKSLVPTAPPEVLRREVLETVSEISRLTQERAIEQRARLETLSTKVRELGSELEVARQESALDGLTRLYNRRAFDERLSQAIAVGRLFGHSACLLLIDLDHFKAINDGFGHVAGDAVLRETADVLVRAFRVKSDFVARFGGEEFGIILMDTELERAHEAAERVRASLAAHRVQYEGRSICFTVSIGVAAALDGEAPEQWLERADRALYEAKHGGRDRVQVGHATSALAVRSPLDR